MVEGEEIFGYEPAAVLKPSGEYNDETDLIFYKEPKQSGAVLLKKEILLLFLRRMHMHRDVCLQTGHAG